MCNFLERGINLLGRTIPGGIPVKGGIEVSEGRFPIPAGNVEGGGIPREKIKHLSNSILKI